MKRFSKICLSCLLAMTSLLITACGGSDDKGKDDPIISNPLIQRSCSLAEGSEVNASDVTSITLSYNAKVVAMPLKFIDFVPVSFPMSNNVKHADKIAFFLISG